MGAPEHTPVMALIGLYPAGGVILMVYDVPLGKVLIFSVSPFIVMVLAEVMLTPSPSYTLHLTTLSVMGLLSKLCHTPVCL